MDFLLSAGTRVCSPVTEPDWKKTSSFINNRVLQLFQCVVKSISISYWCIKASFSIAIGNRILFDGWVFLIKCFILLNHPVCSFETSAPGCDRWPLNAVKIYLPNGAGWGACLDSLIGSELQQKLLLKNKQAVLRKIE